MPSLTSIPSNRVPFIDERTGVVSREWYNFLLNLFQLSGGGSSSNTTEDAMLSGLSVIPEVAADSENMMPAFLAPLVPDDVAPKYEQFSLPSDDLTPRYEIRSFTLSSENANGVVYLDANRLPTTKSTFTFDGTTLSMSGLTASGTVTFSGGTANGVAYLNGSKVVTTGSTFTYDGTTMTVGVITQGSQYRSGNGVTTGDVVAQVGYYRTGDGYALLDLYAEASASFSTRLIRSPGANGVLELKNVGSGDFIVSQTHSAPLVFKIASTECARIDHLTNVIVGDAAINTNATDGFLYVPGCAGTPTGVPTTYSGRIPVVVDSTNNKLYFYSGGAWRDAGP